MKRYSRQILFNPIGETGQTTLMKKHVLLIGVGALGTAIAEGLVRAGIKKLTLIDRDYVELSNLQRQTLYVEADAHQQIPKAIAAKKRLQDMNSEVEIEAHVADANPEFLTPLLKDVALILDATDNFDIRFVINDLSQKYNIPWIYGACVGSYGITYTIIPKETPCLHCLLKAVPLGGATCDTVGIIGPTVGMVVAYQLTDALKILTDNQKRLRKKLISFDLWENQQSAIDVTDLKEATCLSCGTEPTYPYLTFASQTKTAVLCGRNAVQIRPGSTIQLNLSQLMATWSTQGLTVKMNPFLLQLESDDLRMVLFKDGRAMIHGTNDRAVAKKFYYRYLG
ncbi:MAG: MoeB/ThiF family adenylyltransferase [Defluviitaleaceae bacterium]|nr:MoeB/ThiF family adenylyltransferase [Defluviitaleaceae bacterium]